MSKQAQIRSIHNHVFQLGYTGLKIYVHSNEMIYVHSNEWNKQSPHCVSVIIPGHGRVELGRGDTWEDCHAVVQATLAEGKLSTLPIIPEGYPKSTYPACPK